MSRLKRVLVADLPVGVATVQKILMPRLETVAATTLDEAIQELRNGIDLVICGVHFDECQMFDLLQLVKTNPETRNLPFICIRNLDSSLGMSVLEVLRTACEALGAADFIDLVELKSKYGVQKADREFRDALLDHTQSTSSRDESTSTNQPRSWRRFL